MRPCAKETNTSNQQCHCKTVGCAAPVVNELLQTEALTRAGGEKIYEDKISDVRAERPGLTRALEMLRVGDALVVWKLDSLGRSVKQLVDMVGELHKRGIQFKSLTDAIDTGTPAGRFFFHVMASLAEMERELIIERTKISGGYFMPKNSAAPPPAEPGHGIMV